MLDKNKKLIRNLKIVIILPIILISLVLLYHKIKFPNPCEANNFRCRDGGLSIFVPSFYFLLYIGPFLSLNLIILIYRKLKENNKLTISDWLFVFICPVILGLVILYILKSKDFI